jgi:hypothetical protein
MLASGLWYPARMSTKGTLRHGDSWHLYEELLDNILGETTEFVRLELLDVEFTASCHDGRGVIDLKLRREIAEEIGLLPNHS